MPHDKANFSSNRYNRRSLRRDLRTNGTSAEAVLWGSLRAKQIEGTQWRRQFSIGPFILDFYAPQLKLCIELDGEPHYTPDGADYDLRREEWLFREHGIRTIRFENNDIFRHNESIVEYIRKVTREILKEREHPTNCPSVYSERSLQRVASMASRAERGECSALHDGVVGARRAGAFQAKRGAKS